MTEKYITGGVTVTELGLPNTPEMIEAIKSLDAVNDAEVQKKMPMYSLYEPFVRDVYGASSNRIFSESLKVFFTPSGVGVSSVPSKGYKKYFDIYRQELQASDVKFSPDFQKIADENGLTAEEEISKKVKAITNAYERKYLPMSIRKALITGSSMNDYIPEVNTDFFANLGALRGTKVSNVNNVAEEVTRTHFIAKAGSDVVADDIYYGVSLITEKEDYSMMGVLAYCNSMTMASLKSSLNWSDSVTAILNQVKFKNQQSYSLIEDVIFICDPMMADGLVFMCDAGATGEDAFLVRFQSKIAKYRGLAIYQENGFKSFNEYESLEGSKFVIQAESWNLIGRGKVVWLDINTASAGGHLMNTAGFTALQAQADLYTKKITNM